MTTWMQQELRLKPLRRGFHLITDEVLQALPELRRLKTGMLQVFIMHTSASVTINENADPDLPRDLEMAFDQIAREDFPYDHTLEGPDDMPAHVKSSLLGSSVMIPLREGRLCLGTWQGIYVCEHRDHGGSRRLMLTAYGEMSSS